MESLEIHSYDEDEFYTSFERDTELREQMIPMFRE